MSLAFSYRLSNLNEPEPLTVLQSGGGSACTCAATEYRYHDADDFTVSVETFGEDELAEQFTQMVRDYRHHHHLRAAAMESNEERTQWEEQARWAHDTFSAMFRGRFSSSMLESDWPENSMVETLLAWARELGPANNNWSETKASLSECAALLADFTSERSSDQRPAVWPYIKKIRFAGQENRTGMKLFLTAAACFSKPASSARASFW